jgi:hypothetical protein
MISHFKLYKGSEDELFSKTVSQMVNFKNKTKRILFFLNNKKKKNNDPPQYNYEKQKQKVFFIIVSIYTTNMYNFLPKCV